MSLTAYICTAADSVIPYLTVTSWLTFFTVSVWSEYSSLQHLCWHCLACLWPRGQNTLRTGICATCDFWLLTSLPVCIPAEGTLGFSGFFRLPALLRLKTSTLKMETACSSTYKTNMSQLSRQCNFCNIVVPFLCTIMTLIMNSPYHHAGARPNSVTEMCIVSEVSHIRNKGLSSIPKCITKDAPFEIVTGWCEQDRRH